MTSNFQQQLEAALGPGFTVERELGGGGMSRVFLAEETRLGRRVVVKVLESELGVALSADRFEREIQFAARLQDPRIVPLLQAGQVGDLPFYTMPYVEGETLRARLTRPPVPLDEALGILRDVALALEYAHARDVVHRDIKPENILLSGRTAVVADFGIAKAVSAAAPVGGATTLTTMGMIVGTPAYMAPEQAAGDRVDGRADLYAWGVIAYEILLGVHPFASRTTAQALLAAQITETPVPLRQRRPDLPPALATLVDQCLAKDPNQRPRDAAAVVAALSDMAAVRPGFRLRGRHLVPIAVAVGLLGVAGGWLYQRSEHRRWAREDAMPQVGRLAEQNRPLAAFRTLKQAQSYLPADSQIVNSIAELARTIAVRSTPADANIEIQDYLEPNSAWLPLGRTPIAAVEIPRGLIRWRISKPGVGELLVARRSRDTLWFALDSALAAPTGMVRVPADEWTDFVDFVGWVGPYQLPAFYLDRFEVTNRQYQAFVDAGGYLDPHYWTETLAEHGRPLTWAGAMARFRDRSGRAGPSTWEGGHYPQGQADYPVSGVSWYEASAYAAFAGKTLPTFSQWYLAAPASYGRYTVAASNIGRSSPAPVGSFKGLGPFGTYDMAGNVREWTLNTLDADRRFILGGAASSPTYIYAEPEGLSPFDRSAGNGIRCVKNTAPLPANATRPITPFDRDFANVRPASDAVFRAYRTRYMYDRTPLNAKVEGVVEDTPDWRLEKVTLDAAYGNERFAAYLFLPKRVRPPYQTMAFFPSANILGLTSSRELGDGPFFDYVIKSGRAVLYPVYQDTYERRTRGTKPGASQDNAAITAQRAKDLGRALDYLTTRSDIDSTRLGYLGVSMGAAEGVIYTTLWQDRLKAVVLLDGGFFLDPPAPGTDQVDFAPRFTRPVLMVNGRYDFSFSLNRAQLPLFRMLGTPAADKRHVILETPHGVTADRPAMIREVLAWLDKYLGRVE